MKKRENKSEINSDEIPYITLSAMDIKYMIREYY